MNRPIWFHAECIGRVPVHWTPCKWQGWAVIAAFVLAFSGVMAEFVPSAPAKVVPGAAALIAVLIAVAALTDDRSAPFS